ncbi:MAG: T9SS type A sorting domain-containing protein, partial [Crocinitomicaceae bacterium]|nr:T9SS type A sorting domain-containing protein [Crocinitomicaceae bacterium]
YQGPDGWWQSPSWYDANKVRWKVVSGDFDNDEFKDDIAVFYDYGGTSRIHVFTSDGNEFTYQGNLGWWNGGYQSHLFEGRVVSGDFDNDDFHDDIAVLYDYGDSQTRIHVWMSNSNEFIYSGATGWWGYGVIGYDANKVTKRVVSGDFDNDNNFDDIAAFYDYGGTTRIHVWLSTGSGFTYMGGTGWWSDGYQAQRITGRVVSGDFDHDKKVNDIVAFYDYGGGNTVAHGWNSNGDEFIYKGVNGYWQSAPSYYDVNQITGRVVSGDFNNDNHYLFPSNERVDDIAAFYQMSSNETNLHVWTQNRNELVYSGPQGWWKYCQDPPRRSISNQGNFDETKTNNLSENHLFSVYPNPFENEFTVNFQDSNVQGVLSVFNINGQQILEVELSNSAPSSVINTSSWKPGVYVVMYGSTTEKIVKF